MDLTKNCVVCPAGVSRPWTTCHTRSTVEHWNGWYALCFHHAKNVDTGTCEQRAHQRALEVNAACR